MELQKKYVENHKTSTPEFCTFIQIMLSIPPNMGWVERAYSHLELVWPKRRNRLEVAQLKSIFFLAILKLDMKDSFGYMKETESKGKTFPKK